MGQCPVCSTDCPDPASHVAQDHSDQEALAAVARLAAAATAATEIQAVLKRYDEADAETQARMRREVGGS